MQKPAEREKHDDTASAGRDAAWRTGLVLFILALLVRAFFLYEHRANPTFTLPIVDALTYHELAMTLAEGGGFSENFFWQSFFYPVFLSGIYALLGEAALLIRLIQVALGAGISVMGWLLGRRLWSNRAGLIAGLVLVFYGPLIAQEGELLPTIWEAFWLTLLLVLLTSQRSGWLHDVSLGLVAALTVLTRSIFLPFVLLAGAWSTWRHLHSEPLGTAGRKTALRLVVFLAPLLAVATLSHRVTGHFSFVPASGGFNFYLGNNLHSAVTEAMRPGDDASNIYRMAAESGYPGRHASSPFFYRLGLEYIREHPMDFAGGLVRKTAQFFSAREIPRNLDVYLYRQWSSTLSLLIWQRGGFGFPFGLLGPLALLGLIVGWRTQWPMPLKWCAIIVPLTIIAYIAAGRYRIPLIPVFAVLAAGGADFLYQAIKLGRTKTWIACGALLIGIGITICFPREFVVERTDFAAELDYCLGGSLFNRGRIEEAQDRFRAALERNPDYIEARYNYGITLARQGHLDKAVKQWREVLRRAPDDPDAIRALERAHSIAPQLVPTPP